MQRVVTREDGGVERVRCRSRLYPSETPWGQSGREDDGDDVEKEDFGVCAKNNDNLGV